MSEKPTEQAIRPQDRNPTGKGGFGENPENINPGGRPKNSLKSYVAARLAEMSDEEKEKFLKQIAPDMQWKMAEGNPHQSGDMKAQIEMKPFDDV